MIDITEVSVEVVEAHLKKHKSNILFDNYGMPDCCPKNELQCYHVTLQADDLPKLYLVGNFNKETSGTFRLMDVDRDVVLNRQEENRSLKVTNLMTGGEQFEQGINLLEDAGFEPVLFGKSLTAGGYVFIDGSHRAIAHFFNYGTIDGVSAFICIHPKMVNYCFYKHLPNLK